MDLDEWEFLSDDDAFLLNHHHHDHYDQPAVNVVAGGGKKITTHKTHDSHQPNSVFHMDYFSSTTKIINLPTEIPKSPDPIEFIPIQSNPTELIPIQSNPIEVNEKIDSFLEKIKSPVFTLENDQEKNLPQVFFKKMKENEFVDMKLDSPTKSNNNIMNRTDSGSGLFEFNEAKEIIKPETHKMDFEESDVKEEVNNNIWKWSLMGVGAICSIGFAAATICIIVLGNHQRNKYQTANKKLRFQIYTDDKRIKQVVQHANRLKEAISAARGVPLNRADITFGGYYDAI